MNKGYLTVSSETENTIIIERSKFICKIKGVQNEDEAKSFIEQVKKEHSLATHNCYAYVADEFGLVQKFSDDGEPQGTAGIPMLEALKNRKIFKAVAVVTRYFGGVKLGTGGLARAYGGCVLDCLDKCSILDMQEVVTVKVCSDYDGYSAILRLVNLGGIKITDTQFSDKVFLTIAVKTDFYNDFNNKLLDIFKGKPVVDIISKGYASF